MTNNNNELEIINNLTSDMPELLNSATIKVKNEEDRAKASEVIVNLKKKFDSLEDARTSLVKPINDHVKFINSTFKKHTEPIDTAITSLKRAISSYLIEQDRIAREKEAEARRKLEEKNEKREAEGKAPIVKTIESVARPESLSRVEGGKTGAKKVIKIVITNPSLVDKKYCSPDIKLLENALKTGEISLGNNYQGFELVEDYQISAFKS